MKLTNTKVKSQWVARNPIARAVAVNTLKKEATEAQARIFSLQDGEKDRSFIMHTARFFCLVQVAATHDKLHESTEYNFDELMGVINTAMNHFAGMSQNDFAWQYDKARDIADAIEACVAITPKLTPDAVQHAVKAVDHIK